MSTDEASTVIVASSSNGRVSGKSWKRRLTPAVRSHLPFGVRTKKWEDRVEKANKVHATKMRQAEMKQEKEAEIQRRRQITQERKRAAGEKKRLDEERAQMGARKAARFRRKMGRTKNINH